MICKGKYKNIYENYNKDQESSYLMYWDGNNLCAGLGSFSKITC